MPSPRGAFVIGSLIAGTLTASAVAGCLLTSDFDAVAGIRPEAGDLDVDLDAGADGDADAGFCPAGAIVCSNFDQGALDRDGWIVQRSGGVSSTATLDTARFQSAPASFHSTIVAAPAGANAGAILRQTPLVGAFKTLIYAFDMRVLSCGSEGSGGSITLAAIQPSDVVAFGIVLIDSNEYTFAQLDLKGNTFTPTPFSVGPKLDTWSRVSMRVDLSATAAHAVVTLDGKTVVDMDVLPGAPSPGVLLNLGANATGPIKGCDLVYDNVIFTKE